MFKLYITARSKRSSPSVNKYHSANNKVRRPTERKKEEQQWMFSLFLGSSVYRLWTHPEENQFQNPVWLSYLPVSTCCVYRKTSDKANQGENKVRLCHFLQNNVSTCTSPPDCQNLHSDYFGGFLFDHHSGAQRQKPKTKENKNVSLKLLRKDSQLVQTHWHKCSYPYFQINCSTVPAGQGFRTILIFFFFFYTHGQNDDLYISV